MKLKKTFLAVAAVCCTATQTMMGVELVKDSKPVVKIYHAPLLCESEEIEFFEKEKNTLEKFYKKTLAEQDAQLLANAVKDLNYHLKKMSRVELEVVVTDNPKDVKGPALIIGSLASAMGAKPAGKNGNNPEAFRIKAAGDRVLIGCNGDIGASHGVYEVLRMLGCDWLFPGAEGEVIPEKKNVSLADTDITQSPSFNLRHAWYGGLNHNKREQANEFFKWLQRQKMQITHHGNYKIGGHTFYHFNKIFKEELEKNPELYALRKNPDGTLQRRGPQLETTNPRVIELAIDYIRKEFEKNKWSKDADVCIAMGPDDGGGLSVSPESQNAGTDRKSPDSGQPDGTDLIVLFINTILEKTKEEFPNLKLGFFLYSWHADYPMRYQPDPRLAIEIADINFSRLHGVGDESSKSRYYYKNILEQWGNLHKKQGNVMHRWMYAYNVANSYLPISHLKIWGEGIPFDKSIGVSGMRFNMSRDWSVSGASNYLGARMVWDHTLDWKKVVHEYCEKAYGKGADAAEQYMLEMTKRQSESGQEAGSFFSYPLMYDYDFISRMDSLLDMAEKSTDNDIGKLRLKYLKLQPQRLRMFLDFRKKISEFDFVGARAAHQKMLDGLYEDYRLNRNFCSGFDYICGFADRFLTESVKYSTGQYAIAYRIPERLKTAFDRDSYGENLNYFGRDINDKDYIITSTYDSTWDAQGLAGYRKGAVWYRIPVTIPKDYPRYSEPNWIADKRPFGLFIGGAEGRISVWCNGKFIGVFTGYLTSNCHAIDLTKHIDFDKENLIAIKVDRVGNDELGTGGIVMPCFIFTGPQVKMEDKPEQRPFRVLPGGVLEYLK